MMSDAFCSDKATNIYLSNHAGIADLARRVAMLEAANCRLKKISALLAFVIMLAVGIAAHEHDQRRAVVAEEFTLLDAAGLPRATMAASKDGSVALQLMDKNGVARFRAEVNDKLGPVVALANPEGNDLVSLHGSDASSSLTFNDGAGDSWLSMTTQYHNGPTVFQLAHREAGAGIVVSPSIYAAPAGDSGIRFSSGAKFNASLSVRAEGPAMVLGVGNGGDGVSCTVDPKGAARVETRLNGAATSHLP